jgi:hypothetical protein
MHQYVIENKLIINAKEKPKNDYVYKYIAIVCNNGNIPEILLNNS